MKNTKILEIINNGQVEELKALLQDEIFSGSLKSKPGAKQRYTAMKKYFSYVDNAVKTYKMPCAISFEGEKHTSFCNGCSIVYRKREGKEVHKEEFYIVEGRGIAERWTKVIAEPLKKYGLDMFIFCNNGYWNMSLAESGVKVSDGRTKKECIQNLKKYIDIHTREDFLQEVKRKTSLVINSIGVNPRYKTA